MKIFKAVDKFLNGITMYRLMLYLLIFLVLAGLTFCVLGILPFNPIKFVFSTVVLISVCWITNTIFAKIFKAEVNFESIYITALILALIVTPINSVSDIPFTIAAGFFAAASKYVIALKRKHLFNPAAFGVLYAALFFNDYASWWVSSWIMFPFVLVGGLLIIRKIKKLTLVLCFLFVSILVTVGLRGLNQNLMDLIYRVFLQSPILFFAFIMLTEPQTTPPLRRWQIAYGAVVGILFSLPSIRVAGYYLTPEAALLAGNLFSYIVSPKEKLILKLKEKKELSKNILEFIFEPSKKNNKPFKFLAGQYMEWTLPHKNPDSRGERRYFTIASSPTEDFLRIGVKFSDKSSSFKKALLSLEREDTIQAGSLAGDFTLPKDNKQKLCFVAGGIGATPFRSICKFLIDTKEKRDIILLYSAKEVSDFVFKDILNQASEKLGIKKVYILTNSPVPFGWKGRVGYVDEKLIIEEVPDYKERIFYISGPHSMVDTIITILKNMGVSGKQIKEDFFPGYA